MFVTDYINRATLRKHRRRQLTRLGGCGFTVMMVLAIAGVAAWVAVGAGWTAPGALPAPTAVPRPLVEFSVLPFAGGNDVPGVR